MALFATILIACIALQHIGFMVLEMFYWTKPLGLKVFRQSPEKAEISKVLAANQGLYNGFLAAGLIYGLTYWARGASLDIQSLFLSFIVVAGLYGGWSVSRRILLIQAVPAAVALALLWYLRLQYAQYD